MLIQKTIAQLLSQLKNKEYSYHEVTQAYLEQINKHQDINAITGVNNDNALAQAIALDNNGSTSRALSGIPIIHKDLFCTTELETKACSKILETYQSPFNATIVENLKNAGMIMLGKANMDEFAMGSSNENSAFGAVKNPWNTDCVPGGSSGGSAAAVAAHMAPVATASDTGGSIRQPAAFTGTTGIKPTYGRASRYGMIAFASSLDQAGIITKTAEDAALVLENMVGFDAKDSTSLNEPVTPYSNQINQSIEGLRVGLPKEFFSEGLDNEIATAVDVAVKQLESLGAKVVDISLPNSTTGIGCYYVISSAEASSNLSRFDGVRYGRRAPEYSDLEDMYVQSRSQGFGDEVKRRIMIGTYVLSSGYYDAYYLKALKVRRLIKNDFNAAFTQCDVIAGPTTPTTAFAIGSKSNDPVTMYLNDIYTITANLTGLPAMSLPCGLDSKNMPIGLQLIGNYLDESRLLNVAHQYQLNTEWHTKFAPNF